MNDVIQRTFAAGELAPVLHTRADQVKYTQGVRMCRNFFVRREGGLSNRAGFRWVDALKTDTAGTRLMPYFPSTGDGIVVEMGSGYFRFFYQGGAIELSGPAAAYNGATSYIPGDLVSSGGVNYYAHTATVGNAPPNASFWSALTGLIYEIPTPYALDQIPDWNQSGNVITLTHHLHPPRELVFSSLTRWVLRLVSTAPAIVAPAGLAGVAGAAGGRTLRYVVTASAAATYEESIASAPVVVAGAAEPTAALPVALTWTALAGAAEYHVYEDPYGNGVFGYIGTSSANALNDPGFVPDFNVTPPLGRVLFQTASNYPSHAANYQQRRFFANTDNEPDAIYGSRTGFTSNFGISSPLQDDDAITFRIAGNNHHPIHHMRALRSGLVLMTGGGEWTLTGGGGPKTPITPSSIDAEQETYVGVNPRVRPVVVGNALLYVQERATVMRELKFDQQVEGLAGRDLSIWATHLFERKTIVAMDFQQTPHSIIWCVRSDGVLLGLTYIPDQDVWGWHRHDTDGLFEDCVVIPEGDGHALYVIVSRTIGGATKRYLERMEPREIRETYFNLDSFFVDSGLTYDGSPADSFSGLDHLEGKVVAILGDGDVIYNGDPAGASAAAFTVTGGSVDIPTAKSRVHIGLPIRFAEFETLDLDAAGTDARGKKKRVGAATLLVDRSSRTMQVGRDATALQSYSRQDWEPAADETTGQLEITIESTFEQAGRVLVRQTDPLPVTILGIIPTVELGG